MTLPNGNQNQNQDPIPGQTSGTGRRRRYRRAGRRRRRPPAYLTAHGRPPAVASAPRMTASHSTCRPASFPKTWTSRSPLSMTRKIWSSTRSGSQSSNASCSRPKRPGGQDFARADSPAGPGSASNTPTKTCEGASAETYPYTAGAAPAIPWQEIPCVNDRERQVVTADLEHFSEYLANVAADQSIVPTIDANQSNLQTGASSVSIPIKLPPGTNGLTPKLALSYSSAGANGIISE